MSGSIFYVYQHRRKDDGRIFYVGKGKGKRAYSLVRGLFWKRVVAKHGFIVEFLKTDLTEEDAFALEIETIRLYRSQDIELINLTDGGEGTTGRVTSDESRVRYRESRLGNKNPMFHKTHSDEIKQRISQASKESHSKPGYTASLAQKLKGIVRSDSTKEKIRKFRTGKHHSAETKQKLSLSKKGKPSGRKGAELSDSTKSLLRQINLGKKLSQETKNKIGESSRGRRLTEDAKKKISEANKGRISVRRGQTGFKTSEATKEKLRQLNLGKQLSAETRQRMSEAQKKAHAKGKRVVSEETKQKIREKLQGKKLSEETRKKMSDSQKERANRSK